MASEQITAPALQELLKNATLAGQWRLDPARSTVALKNKSIWGLVPVNGVFRQVTGTGAIAPTGEVNGSITVKAASVDTRNSKRDTHLRSADFFDIDNYPDITFTVTDIRPSGGQGAGIAVTGILRVRDRARPLTFDGSAVADGYDEVSLDAIATIRQPDFGLTWNFLGMLSAKTTMTVHAVFTRH